MHGFTLKYLSYFSLEKDDMFHININKRNINTLLYIFIRFIIL